MSKFIGVKNGKIQIISDTKFINSEFKILELTDKYTNISPNELILNYVVKDNILYHKNERQQIEKLKIAIVTNYGMACGIATYSKFLYDELIKYAGSYKIFAEKFSGQPPDNDNLLHCWKRGESLTDLINAIKNYNPDVILIQHEWGLWPNSRQWLSMMSQLSDYRIIVTMHSIFRHRDKLIVESSIPEIIVHLEGAKNVLLNEKKISGKVHVLPHGCFLPNEKPKIWNFYKTEQNFIQFGFLFKYKGFENSIKAVSLLKEKYPNIYFTGICSESKHATIEHNRYYNELMELVNSLGLNENVSLIKGYQSEFVLDTFLYMNKAAVFPYLTTDGHECFGSSGAAPYAMSKQIPIITSNIHHFKDLPTLKINSSEEIAIELDKIFSKKDYAKNQIIKQNIYLENNSWENIIKKYISIIENK